MELAIALAVGVIVGAVCAGYVHRGELRYLREELKVAHAQIAHAVLEDHAIIPPRIEPIPELEPLPSDLQACVDQWDSPESRAIEEAKVRGYMAEGWGNAAILRQYGVNETT